MTYYTTSFLNIFAALAFTQGPPFRQPMIKNWIFVGWAFICFVYVMLTVLTPYTDWISGPIKEMNHYMLDMNMVIFFRLKK